ncbi:MAG: DUF4019 domain-containing protein [Acidobacteriota bacterium]
MAKLRWRRFPLALSLVLAVLLCFSCSQPVRRSGVPADAQAVLDRSLEDIDAGRYDKLYHEAADEWRTESTLDESKATFQRLHERLGNVRIRNFQNAREEQTSSGPNKGHSVVIGYQTTFDRGEGMETVTLLERGGQWYLGRYFVSSTALR